MTTQDHRMERNDSNPNFAGVPQAEAAAVTPPSQPEYADPAYAEPAHAESEPLAEVQSHDDVVPPAQEPSQPADFSEPSSPASFDQPESAPTPVSTGNAVADSGDAAVDSRHTAADSDDDGQLFSGEDFTGFRSRWDSVQAGFVDDPKACVQNADGLVSEVVQELTAGFADARSRLEAQWSRGEEASTEDLRLTLKRYREFFDRLLAV